MSNASVQKKVKPKSKSRVFKNRTQPEYAFKGFSKGYICRSYQFKTDGTVHSIDKRGTIKLCNTGFHACEHPDDVLRHYSISDHVDNVFALVKMYGHMHKRGDKQCSRHLEIVKKLTKKQFIDLVVLSRRLRVKKLTKKQINTFLITHLGF